MSERILAKDIEEWLHYPLLAWPFILYYRWFMRAKHRIDERRKEAGGE